MQAVLELFFLLPPPPECWMTGLEHHAQLEILIVVYICQNSVSGILNYTLNRKGEFLFCVSHSSISLLEKAQRDQSDSVGKE